MRAGTEITSDANAARKFVFSFSFFLFNDMVTRRNVNGPVG